MSSRHATLNLRKQNLKGSTLAELPGKFQNLILDLVFQQGV